MNYFLLRIMPLVLTMMCLSGCWDKKELNDLAVVMGVGLDKGENGEIQITAQVIRPPAKQGGSAGGSSLPTWSLSESGSTVMDAIAHLNEISPRRLYWPHMQIIILGDAIARDGIAPFLNWFERNLESRTGTLLAVTQGKAADLLAEYQNPARQRARQNHGRFDPNRGCATAADKKDDVKGVYELSVDSWNRHVDGRH